MKKILFACLLVMFVASALAQTHTFESIAFTAGGTISQCAFAPTSLTFNNTNYLVFPGFGTTHTTSAYGDHTHAGLGLWGVNGNDIYATNIGNVGIGTSAPGSNYRLDVAGPLKGTSNGTWAMGVTGMASAGCGVLGSTSSNGYGVKGTGSVSGSTGIYGENVSGTGASGYSNSGTGGYFGSSAGTGLYVYTTTGNSAIFTGGSVGIGITAPTAQLHVYSNVAGQRCIIANAVGTGATFGVDASGYYGVRAAGSYVGLDASSNNTAINAASVYTYGVYATSTNGIAICGNSPNGYAAIFNQGNVGIGLTNPTVKVDIAGGLRASSSTTTCINAAASSNANGGMFTTATGTAGTFSAGTGTALNASSTSGYAALFGPGKVGIGITNPTELLDVHGNIKSFLNVFASGGQAQFNQSNLITYNDDFEFRVEGGSSSRLHFWTAGVEAMTVDEHQNLAIAKSFGIEKIDVNGSINADSAFKTKGLITGIKKVSSKEYPEGGYYLNFAGMDPTQAREYQHTIIVLDVQQDQTMQFWLPDPNTCLGQEFTISNISDYTEDQNILIVCSLAGSKVWGVNPNALALDDPGVYFDYDNSYDETNIKGQFGQGSMTFQAINDGYILIAKQIKKGAPLKF